MTTPATPHLNEPPTAEEMLSYTRGELAPDEAARVRKRLEAYPDLARAYTEPFPADDLRPGDPYYVSEAQLDQRWAAFKKDVHPHEGGRVVEFPRFLSAIAAGLIVVLGALLVASQTKVRRLEHELATPRVIREYAIPSDGYRGGPGETPTIADADARIVIQFTGVHFADYRAEIRDLSSTPPPRLWDRSGMIRDENDEFEVLIPRQFLQRGGRYQVVLYGIDGVKEEERLATYTFKVEQ